MSELPGPSEAALATATYDRMLQETRRFSAEQTKLQAEARKYDRDRWPAYVTALGALMAGIATSVGLLLNSVRR